MLENWNMGSVDTISSYFFEFKREAGKYFTGRDVKGNSLLPNSKLFKPSIDIFSFHYWFISWIVIFFTKGKKSIIPTFHYSN